MKCGEVIFSVCDYAKDFIREYKYSELEQRTIDAILVDYINYFAYTKCALDLALYTRDLKDGEKMSEEGADLQMQIIATELLSCKEQYLEFGILESVNRNSHMNECEGKARFSDAEALKVIDDFISYYKNIY